MIALRILAGMVAAAIIVSAVIVLWFKADEDARWAMKGLGFVVAGAAVLAGVVSLIQFAATGSLS